MFGKRSLVSAAAAAVLASVVAAGSATAQEKSKGPLKVAIFSVNAASPTIHTMIEVRDRRRQGARLDGRNL